MKWLIYKHTSPSGKCYIGKTCNNNANERWRNGHGYTKKDQLKMYNAIQKYGWNNFTHEIIENNIPTLKEANIREKYWIAFYNSFKHGYNMTEGGEGSPGRIFSEETKQKISNSQKGQHHSPRTEIKPGQRISPATEFKKGHKNSPEVIEKIRRALVGKKRSKEIVNKVASKNKIKIIQKDEKGNFIREWLSAADVERELKINANNIYACCKRKRNKAGGFLWSYK